MELLIEKKHNSADSGVTSLCIKRKKRETMN